MGYDIHGQSIKAAGPEQSGRVGAVNWWPPGVQITAASGGNPAAPEGEIERELRLLGDAVDDLVTSVMNLSGGLDSVLAPDAPSEAPPSPTVCESKLGARLANIRARITLASGGAASIRDRIRL